MAPSSDAKVEEKANVVKRTQTRVNFMVSVSKKLASLFFGVTIFGVSLLLASDFE